MTAENLAYSKREIEVRIAQYIQRELNALETATGWTPESVDVHMIEVGLLSENIPKYKVGQVKLRFSL